MTIDEKSDRKAVLAAVKEDGLALEYASEDLKADREIVLAAVKSATLLSPLQYASDDLKADRELVLAAGKQNGIALRSASEDLKADRDIVLAVVKHHGSALAYASEDLKADREIVLAAAKTYSGVFHHASKDLKGDREIVLKIIHSDLEDFLGEIIETHKDYFREENTFKIRPGIAYDKFYINQVDGSYDMSLQGLLHHYLWEHEFYHLFLNDKELETCRQLVEEQPEYTFGPDDDKTREIIDEIEFEAISFVGKKLIELGFDVEQDFEGYLN